MSELKLDTGKVAEIMKIGAAIKQIPLWLSTTVGGISRKKLITDLDNVAVGNTGLTFQISHYAKNLTLKPECVISTTAEEAEFAIAAPQDLGFKTNPTTDKFFNEKNLTKYGLELCKPDDAHSLRKAYTNQPNGEWLPVGMKPIRASGGWRVFRLEHYGPKLWLRGGCGASPRSRWGLGSRLVFRVRKIQNLGLGIQR